MASAPSTLRSALHLAIKAASSTSRCPNCRTLSTASSLQRGLSTPHRPFSIFHASSIQSQPSRRRAFSSTSPRLTYYDLSNTRGLIRMVGVDVGRFLDGLLPAKILGTRDDAGSLIYTAFLTAQGRVLVDVFIYGPPNPTSAQDGKEPEWFLECDRESVPLLMKHLKKHKLRTKFKLENILPEEASVVFADQVPDDFVTRDGIRGSGQDRRPGMNGVRVIIGAQAREELGANGIVGQAAEATKYLEKRMLNGMAEGQGELISEHALPQESNIDLLGGIDFHKGCYLGQELTIRTHHTGVVRKRILPVQLYEVGHDLRGQRVPTSDSWNPSLTPPPGANLSKVSTRKGRSTGKLLGSVGNVGLALCRLEMMTDIQLTAEATNYNPEEEYQVTWQDQDSGEDKKVLVKPFVPEWVREGIEANLKRKERRPKNDAVDGEDDGD